MRKISVAIFLCLINLSSSLAFAAEEGVFNLCPALSKESTYKDSDKEDFRLIVSGKDGWIFRTDYDLRQTHDDFDLSEWSINSFKRLRHAFQKKGTDLSVVMLPTRGLVGYKHLIEPYASQYNHAEALAGYGRLLDGIAQTGIIVADTRDVDKVDGYFLKRDNHWTAIGARYTAEKMAKAIKLSSVYSALKPAVFETKTEKHADPMNANDNFLEFIQETCGSAPEPEKISETFVTFKKGEGDVQSALLGDGDKPEVVLLGTSQSTEPKPSHANFVGFLREYLGVDVKNDSIMGGSIRGAMGNYVLTGDYAKNQPKLIIWELSAHYGFEQRSFFREIIPAIYGICSDAEAIAISSGQVNPKETVILENLGDKNLVSYNYYLALELEDKDEREVKVDFIHMGKKADTMEFERSMRNFPNNNGIYFAELRFGINEPLESVKVTLKNGKGGYKAKICKVP